MIRRVVSTGSSAPQVLLVTLGWAIACWQPDAARAQFETPGPRIVRPAVPVAPAASSDDGPPVARAVPFASPAPANTSAFTSTSPSNSAPAADESGDIRLAPQAPGVPATPPDVEEFNLASDFYKRKDYTQAAAEYERYLGQFSDGPQRQAALWWLGECYRILDRTPAARSSYQNLIIAFKEGEFVGPACFRLAAIDFNAKDYHSALPLFERSAQLAKADDVRLSSLYFEAICLEQLNRRDETVPIYLDIVAIGTNNPYRDDARLALARIALAGKKQEDAFKQYEALSREASKPSLQAESSLKAGLLAVDLNQPEIAASLFTHAINLSGASAAVRADAMVAQLHLLYDTNKYRQLVDTYPDFRPALPDALQPEAMLLAANAQRQLGQHAKAQAGYDEIIAQYPRSPQAPEARYQRVISLYASGDPSFIKEADEFVTQSSDPVEYDQVRLMKADTLFKQGNYLQAAYAYNILDGSPNLPDRYKAETAYRLAYCYAQGHDAEKTIAAFTRFLHVYPNHPFAVKALIQRAVALQQEKNFTGALADFQTVIEEHPDAKEREASIQQKALILGQEGDVHGMTDAFHELLKDYPKTDAAGLANFFIGQAAFDAADYSAALPSFDAARRADPKDYDAKAGLLIILCEFQLKNAPKLAGEIASYENAKRQPPVPSEILRWLGEEEFNAKDFSAAEEHLSTATTSPGNLLPDTLLLLARSRLKLDKWDGALAAAGHYLEASATLEPAARAEGLLAEGEAQLGLQNYDAAQKASEDMLELQPEGTLNARARMLAGRVASARGQYADAAKSFMSVSVLYDDPEITPMALAQAAEAFTKAGEPDESAKATEELKTRFPDYTAPKLAE